nr:DUF930 domain-containing protein [Hoeflea algicola]
MLMGFGIPTASALDNGRIDQQLLKLDPKTRLEQTCDTEVMFAINRSENAYNVDKVIAYTFEDTIMGKNQIKAPGAAFRSRGKWSRLSYSCATGPRHLNARTLHYKIGSEIPRDQWRDYNLYD